PNIYNSFFLNNYASGAGGAIYNACDNSGQAGPNFIYNSVYYGNQTAGSGGVEENMSYSGAIRPSFINCDFVGNQASGKGTCFYNFSSSVILSNSIVWGNSFILSQTIGNLIQDYDKTGAQVYLSTINYSIIQGGFTGTGNMATDPLFVGSGAGPDNIWGTADDGFMLGCNSPARDAGTSFAWTQDILGNPRPFGNAVDIGAYEIETSDQPVKASLSIATSGSLCAASPVVFNATYSNGGSNPKFYWLKNNSLVASNVTTYADSNLSYKDSLFCIMYSNLYCTINKTDSSNVLKFSNSAVNKPIITISSDSNRICEGSTIPFKATISAGGPNPIFNWYKNDTLVVGATGSTYTFNNYHKGDSVFCTLISSSICSDTNIVRSKKLAVRVFSSPNISLKGSLCSSSNITVGSDSTLNVINWKSSYYPYTSISTYYGAAVNTAFIGTSQYGSLILSVTDKNGCQNAINPVVINDTVRPYINIYSNQGNSVCAGTLVNFNAYSNNGGTKPSYQWAVNGVKVGIDSIGYANNTLPDSALVSCKVLSNAACLTIDTVSAFLKMSVNKYLHPSVVIASNVPQTVCGNTAINVKATIADGGINPSITWYKNNNSITSGSFFYTDSLNTSISGKDSFYAVIYVNGQCVFQTLDSSNVLRFNVKPKPSLGGTISFAKCNSGLFDLTSLYKDTTVSYLWNTANPYKTDIGSYQVIGTKNSSGCKDTANFILSNITPVTVSLSGGNCQSANLSANSSQNFSSLNWVCNNKVLQTVNYSSVYYAGTDTNGITIAGGNGGSILQNQLADYPGGLFVDKKGNVFVADATNNRIMKWLKGATSGITVAGGNGAGNATNQLNYPLGVYVDTSGNIYIADSRNHRVQKWKDGDSYGKTVAGNAAAVAGSTSNLLNNPTGIYVDVANNIYISDYLNNRIQKWASGAINGTTVAGGNGAGSGANQLNTPMSVWVNEKNNNDVYIADAGNNRIQVWSAYTTAGYTIMGGNNSGSGLNQFNRVSGMVMSPDRSTVFACDEYNNRIVSYNIYSGTTTILIGANG
ncbi:MAG: choice-of-anchor Q domain-containing protein, partial [Bacteroidota bacterium]